MKFLNVEHETFYNDQLERFEVSEHDRERQALFFVLGLLDTTREHIDSIYDKHGIKPSCLNDGFQTGTSIAITQLAFSLYNNFSTPHESYPEVYCYPSLMNMFCRIPFEVVPYVYQAISHRLGIKE